MVSSFGLVPSYSSLTQHGLEYDSVSKTERELCTRVDKLDDVMTKQGLLCSAIGGVDGSVQSLN